MIKHTLLLLFTLLLFGCGRSPNGLYQTVGSEDKFRMTLQISSGGQAKFITRSNVGNPEVDRAAESTMSIDSGRWTADGPNVVVTGAARDGKALTYHFVTQENGDLIWQKNGARFVKSK